MKETDPIEILTQLENFYNNAWNKLVISTTIVLFIVGVIVPLIISWLQNRNLKLKEENLRKDIEADNREKLSLVKEEILEQIQNDIDKKIVELEKKQDKSLAQIQGLHFHLQAISTQDNSIGKVRDYVYASEFYIQGEDFMNLKTVMDNLNSEIVNISKEDLEDLIEEKADVKGLLDSLEKNDDKGVFRSQIKEIRKKLRLLSENKEKK